MEDGFKTEVQNGRGIIHLRGDLDDEVAGESLRKAFNTLFDNGERTVVLDLDGVEIINSYGIGKILICYKRLKAEGGELMVRPLKGVVKETFELLMLDTLFPIEPAGE